MDERMLQMQKFTRRSGLLAGLCAGLGFSLALWGRQAFSMWRASAEFPWLLALTGFLLTLGICTLAGWLTARLDQALLGTLIWMGAGFLLGWLVLQINFRWINQFIEFFNPDLAGLHVFPLEGYVGQFLGVVLVIIGLTSGLAGLFQLFIIESAVHARTPLARLTILALNVLLFALVGLVADYIVQRPMREPVMAVTEMIELAIENRENPVPLTVAREMHLRALKPLGEQIFHPYTLTIGAFDPDSIMSSSVHIKLSDGWATCHVFEGHLNFCELSEKAYLQKLECLLAGNPDYGCRLKFMEGADTQLMAMKKVLGQEYQLSIARQTGEVIIIDVRAESGMKYRCVVRRRGEFYLESCQPAQ